MQSHRVLQDSVYDKVLNKNRAMDPKILKFKIFDESIWHRLFGSDYD